MAKAQLTFTDKGANSIILQTEVFDADDDNVYPSLLYASTVSALMRSGVLEDLAEIVLVAFEDGVDPIEYISQHFGKSENEANT